MFLSVWQSDIFLSLCQFGLFFSVCQFDIFLPVCQFVIFLSVCQFDIFFSVCQFDIFLSVCQFDIFCPLKVGGGGEGWEESRKSSPSLNSIRKVNHRTRDKNSSCSRTIWMFTFLYKYTDIFSSIDNNNFSKNCIWR